MLKKLKAERSCNRHCCRNPLSYIHLLVRKLKSLQGMPCPLSSGCDPSGILWAPALTWNITVSMERHFWVKFWPCWPWQVFCNWMKWKENLILFIQKRSWEPELAPRYKTEGILYFWVSRDLLLVWKVTGWIRKGRNIKKSSSNFTVFLVFQRGRKLGSVII